MSLVKVLVYFILGTIPIFFASVQPWVWSFYAFCIITGFILFLWKLRVATNPTLSFGGIQLAVGTFFMISLLLCLPLPPEMISLLSPERFQKISISWRLTDSHRAWAPVSYTSQDSLAWWVFLLSLLLFFIIARELSKNKQTLRTIVFIMVGIGLLESVYGLVQALTPSLGVLWVNYIEDYMGTARGTFINRNNFAAFINMVWPLALGVTLERYGKVNSVKATLSSDRLNRHALMALGIILLLLAVILTRSRAGILSAIVGFVTFIMMVRTKKNVARQIKAVLIGIMVLLCAYSVIVGVGPIMKRFSTLGSESDFRWLIWSDSLSIVKNHPLGTGLRSYENVFSVYNHSYLSDKRIVYAHNDYLQLLIETGWLGFLTLIGGFIFFIGKSLRLIRRLDPQKNSSRFFFAVGAFSGLMSTTFHSFFDFNLQIPANCLYFVLLMAVLNISAAHDQKSHTRQSASLDLIDYIRPAQISAPRNRLSS